VPSRTGLTQLLSAHLPLVPERRNEYELPPIIAKRFRRLKAYGQSGEQAYARPTRDDAVLGFETVRIKGVLDCGHITSHDDFLIKLLLDLCPASCAHTGPCLR